MMSESSRRRIFIVDDDLSVQKSLKRLLANFDFEVAAYGSGEEFLNAVIGIVSGCVILDVHMNGMNGLELQKKLSEVNPRLSVIFITADKNKTTEQYAMKAGARAYLQKPFTRKDLIESINSTF